MTRAIPGPCLRPMEKAHSMILSTTGAAGETPAAPAQAEATVCRGHGLEGWRLSRVALLAMLVPALLCFLSICAWRYPCVGGDSWIILAEGMEAATAGNTWSVICSRFNEHWIVPCRAAMYASLHWFPGDMSWLPLIGWLTGIGLMQLLVRETRPWLGRRCRKHVLL